MLKIFKHFQGGNKVAGFHYLCVFHQYTAKKKPPPIYPDAYASINYKKTHTMYFLKEMDGVRGWEIVNTELKLNLIISKILK